MLTVLALLAFGALASYLTFIRRNRANEELILALSKKLNRSDATLKRMAIENFRLKQENSLFKKQADAALD